MSEPQRTPSAMYEHLRSEIRRVKAAIDQNNAECQEQHGETPDDVSPNGGHQPTDDVSGEFLKLLSQIRDDEIATAILEINERYELLKNELFADNPPAYERPIKSHEQN